MPKSVKKRLVRKPMRKAVKKTKTRAQWAKEICAIYKRTAQTVLEMGDKLIEAKEGKNKLPHGEFTKMIENDLPFGPSTAQRIMKIARDPRLRKAARVQVLPTTWGTLYELTKLPDDAFKQAMASGTIHPKMRRADIQPRHYKQARSMIQYESLQLPTVSKAFAKEFAAQVKASAGQNSFVVGATHAFVPVPPFETCLCQIERHVEELNEFESSEATTDAIERIRSAAKQLVTMADRIEEERGNVVTLPTTKV